MPISHNATVWCLMYDCFGKSQIFFEKNRCLAVINGQIWTLTDWYGEVWILMKGLHKEMNWIALSSERLDVIRDDCGVPIEWTLLKIGTNPICQEGIDGTLNLTAQSMQKIINYHRKKGEEIPIDSEHYLYELANQKRLDESEVLRLFPSGVAAMGFGSLALEGENIRLKVKWNPTAYEMLKEKIYKYFSPVLRGLVDGNLRVTSVAMTNTPAINNLDALAASANNMSGLSDGSDLSDKTERNQSMTKVEKALKKLLGRDAIALSAENEKEQDAIAAEIEEKADLIEQVKKLLGLDAAAGIDEVIAALKAEAEKAASADEKQAQLDELAAAAEKDAHARLVARGRAEGKITNADMEYVNSLDSKALSAHLAHTGRKVPTDRLPEGKRSESDTSALTEADKLAINALKNAGVENAEEEYLNRKKKEVEE